MTSAKGVAPGFLLMPAREYEWELKGRISIRIPVEGLISEHISDADLSKGIKIAGDDAFQVQEGSDTFLWDVVRVLFATSRYPNLEDNESLNVVAMVREGNELVLHGEVIQVVA